MNDWRTARHERRNHDGVDLYFPDEELQQEPYYWNRDRDRDPDPNFALLA